MSLKRPTQEIKQKSLFDIDPSWKKEWWGMPEFTMGEATPQHTIKINFMTMEDVCEFARITGLRLTSKSNSAWFPPQQLDQPKEWAYVED